MSFTAFSRSITQASGKVPLRIVLVVPFVLQIATAVGLVGWLSFRNGQQAVNNVALQLRREISSRIQQNLQAYLEEPHRINESNRNAVDLGLLKMQSLSPWEKYLWRQVELFPNMYFVGLVNKRGQDRSGEKLSTGSRTLNVIDQFTQGDFYTYQTDPQGNRTQIIATTKNVNPLKHPNYTDAAKAGKATWSSVYVSFVEPTLVVSALLPLYQSNQLEGVLIAALRLDNLGRFLKSLKIGKSGQTFIMDREGHLLATSTSETPFRVNAQEKQLFKATESSDQVTQKTAQYLEQNFQQFKQIQDTYQLNFAIEGEPQFLQVVPYQDGKSLDWLIVVVVPEADFMEQINENNRTTILLCFMALLITTGLGIATSKYIVRPILKLKDASIALSEGQFDATVDVERSDELGVLAKAFNSMTRQLQESFKTLESKNEELQQLDLLKDEFLANTSHELRTPLNGIIGLAESLIDGVAGELPEQVKTNLAMIVLSGRRLASLVNDILDFSKLKHKNIELQIKPVGMRESVEIVLALSQPLIGKKPLELRNAISPDLPPANADENRVQQILHNLIANAIKFTEAGLVEISAALKTDAEVETSQLSLPSTYLAITISDTGIGIPEDKLERIFESFEQVDGSTSRIYGGTGLGLAVTKQLVELQGGKIWVTSQLGVGSQFTFTLPVSQGQVEENLTLKPLKTSGNLAKFIDLVATADRDTATEQGETQILIVDDEIVNLHVLVNTLSLQHYAILQAMNGLEALEILERGFKPDLILLDVMMPKMTGYEVTKKVREMWPANELPILLLTAKNRVSDLVAGFEAGANDYLTKPVEKDELLARIQTHINLAKLTSENLRLGAELEVTRKLQQMLLPKAEELQAIEALDIVGYMEPATEVGGDYYDILQQGNSLKICIGDVTGHGLESGVLMMMVQMAVRTLLTSNITNPIQFLSLLNLATYSNLQRMDCQKTMTISLLDYAEGNLKISGQHEDIILVRSGGEIELMDTSFLGFPIGLEADITEFVSVIELSLNPGDGIVLYTDGVTEAEDLNGVQYGLERLTQIVSQDWERPVSEILQAVIDDLHQHLGTRTIQDDITLLIFKQKT